MFYLVCVGLLAFSLSAFRDPLSFGVLTWTPGHVYTTHRVHHVALGAVFGLFVLGLAAQLYRPRARVGWLQTSLLVFGLLAVVQAIVAGVGEAAGLLLFLGPAIVIGLLHPERGALVPSLPRREDLDPRVLGVALVGAVPLAIFAATQVDLQLTAADSHANFGHYAMMATASLFVAVAAVLGSLTSTGWRTLVYAAAVVAILAGVMTVRYPGPEQGVGVGILGGLDAVVWGLAFVSVAAYADVQRGARSE